MRDRLLATITLMALFPAVALGHGEHAAHEAGGGTGAGIGPWAWILLAGLGGLAGLAVYRARLRATSRAARHGEPLDLLSIPWLRALLTSRALQPALQVPMLVLMAVVIIVGLGDVQDGGVNLATKLTWTIWWAGVIFTFALLGRVWCLACPFGALNEWTSRLAAPLRRLPRGFRNIWWATGMFVVLTWADEQLGVVRSPRVTAWIVIGVAAMAVGVGLFYERRSFCRHLCPIGGLIGIYSMVAPLELRARHAAVCRADRDQACYRGGEGSGGCPMFEFPQTMDRNNYCTLCAECVKGCGQRNLILRVRTFGQDLWASRRHLLDESYLAIVLVGLTSLVTAQMLAAWPDWITAASRWAPPAHETRRLVESIAFLGGTLAGGPLLLLAASSLSHRLAGSASIGVRRTFVTFGYMFVPVGLALHLAHNLGHLLVEGGGIVPVVQRALFVYTPLSLGEPDWQVHALAPPTAVGLLQAAVLAGFFVLSLVTGHRLAGRAYGDGRVAARAMVPMVALAFAFTALGIVLLSLPMGLRHAT